MTLLKRPKKKTKPKLNKPGAKKSIAPVLSPVRDKSPRAVMPTGKSPNTLAYIVPPIILFAIFAYCGTHTFVPKEKPAAPAIRQISAQASRSTPASEPSLVEPDDVNNNLSAFSWAANERNLLTSALAKVSQSGGSKRYPAGNAIDGSIKNDAKLAQSRPSNGQTWWKADFINGTTPAVVSTVVIYGGGSASPVGKLKGGFEVVLEGAEGQNYSRRFCEEGFALEGYESWILDVPTKLRSITITPLNAENSLVLREVQAIGAN